MYDRVAANQEVGQGVLAKLEFRAASPARNLLSGPALRAGGQPGSSAAVIDPGLARPMERLPARWLKADAHVLKKAVQVSRPVEEWGHLRVDGLADDGSAQRHSAGHPVDAFGGLPLKEVDEDVRVNGGVH